jgi:hypothetical protein
MVTAAEDYHEPAIAMPVKEGVLDDGHPDLGAGR